jgi:hypothetical protein
MKIRPLLLAIVVLMGMGAMVSATATNYLRGGFDAKPLDAPIWTRGAEFGEPVRVDPAVRAIVRLLPMPTASLEISDNSSVDGGDVHFEFVDQQEVTSGTLVIRATFWFQDFDGYHLLVREQGTSTADFLSIYFNGNGTVAVGDADSSPSVVATYDLDRHYFVRVAFDLDAGTYSLWLDGVEVLTDEPHGVSGHGVGSISIGHGADNDLSGTFFLDDIYAGTWDGPVYHVRANFNTKEIGQPIGTGGPEYGEPTDMDENWIETLVTDQVMATPCLAISDNSDWWSGYVGFGFFGDAEVTTGRIVISAELFFQATEDFTITIREAISSACQFPELLFYEDGHVRCQDAGGLLPWIGDYPLGRRTRFTFDFDMDAGTYDLWFDGNLVIQDEPYDLTGCGIGSVHFGTRHDSDYLGTMFVDNIQAASVYPYAYGVCCRNDQCKVLIPPDCMFLEGQFFDAWDSCDADPCVNSDVPDDLGDGALVLRVQPTPFTRRTVLHFWGASRRRVRLGVFDVRGRLVRRLLDGPVPEGMGSVVWDGRDETGASVPGGVYFVRMRDGRSSVNRRVVMLR